MVSEIKIDETLLLTAQHYIMGCPLHIVLIGILLYPKEDMPDSLISCHDETLHKKWRNPEWKPTFFVQWNSSDGWN